MRMIAFTYRCPSTGMLVQSWATDVDAEGTAGSTYITMQCPTCSRIGGWHAP